MSHNLQPARAEHYHEPSRTVKDVAGIEKLLSRSSDGLSLQVLKQAKARTHQAITNQIELVLGQPTTNADDRELWEAWKENPDHEALLLRRDIVKKMIKRDDRLKELFVLYDRLKRAIDGAEAVEAKN